MSKSDPEMNGGRVGVNNVSCVTMATFRRRMFAFPTLFEGQEEISPTDFAELGKSTTAICGEF